MRTEMSIKTKLLTGFGIIIFASAVVAITALSTSGGSGTQMETRLMQMKAVAELGAANSASAMRLSEGATDSTQASASSEKSESQNLEKLKGSVSSEREKALFQALSGKMASFASTRNKVAALSNEGGKAEALMALRVLREKQAEYQVALTELVFCSVSSLC